MKWILIILLFCSCTKHTFIEQEPREETQCEILILFDIGKLVSFNELYIDSEAKCYRLTGITTINDTLFIKSFDTYEEPYNILKKITKERYYIVE
jgi:hypothetical protein